MVLTGCGKDDREYPERLEAFETEHTKEEELSEERIEELTGSIEKYEELVNSRVEASAQLGEHYKMLGIELLTGKCTAKR